jgi:biopolymer transport protein ExbD
VKNSRRIKRMSRNRMTVPKMNITALMDIFTILVFFLLVNSATTEVLETPKQITLPASFVEAKPRETIVIFISEDDVTVQGEVVVRTADILGAETESIRPIGDRLEELSENIIGLNTQTIAQSQEVTILADREVPFTVIKRVMSTCTGQGYEKISLAVLQKAPETRLSQN